jgi:hypothetical protein
MSDNPEFDFILEEEFGGEEEFIEQARNTAVKEIVDQFPPEKFDFTLVDGTRLSLSEGQAYELAANMAAQFNWSCYVASLGELANFIERVMDKPMPNSIRNSLAVVAENSHFWLHPKGLVPCHNILVAFFLMENGLLSLKEGMSAVEQAINELFNSLNESPMYEESQNISNTPIEQIMNDLLDAAANGLDIPQDLLNEILEDLRRIHNEEEEG